MRTLEGELVQRVGVGGAVAVEEDTAEKAVLEAEGVGDGNGGECADGPASDNFSFGGVGGLCRCGERQ